MQEILDDLHTRRQAVRDGAIGVVRLIGARQGRQPADYRC
jgi:hypothetical protein